MAYRLDLIGCYVCRLKRVGSAAAQVAALQVALLALHLDCAPSLFPVAPRSAIVSQWKPPHALCCQQAVDMCCLYMDVCLITVPTLLNTSVHPMCHVKRQTCKECCSSGSSSRGSTANEASSIQLASGQPPARKAAGDLHVLQLDSTRTSAHLACWCRVLHFHVLLLLA